MIDMQGGMFSSKTDMWETPQDLFDRLNQEFHFDLDVCATKENAKCQRFFMHLVRLYLMCIDILEKEEIVTYREKDHDLLMDIRNGKYQHADGTFDNAFFDMVDELSKKMDYAKANTSLPRSPDMKKIEEFVMDVNKRSL